VKKVTKFRLSVFQSEAIRWKFLALVKIQKVFSESYKAEVLYSSIVEIIYDDIILRNFFILKFVYI